MVKPDLNEKRGLILGAETTAGQTISLTLAEAGADLAIVSAREDAESALISKRVASRVAKLGRQGHAIAIDAAITRAVRVAIRQATKKLGGLDIAVISTEAQQSGPIDRLSESSWTQLVGLNLSAVLFAVRETAREMTSHDGGSIIVIAQAGGHDIDNILCATAIQLTQCLAQEYTDGIIRISAVSYTGDTTPQDLGDKILALTNQTGKTGQLISI